MNSNQGAVKRPSQVFAMKVLDAFRAAGRLTDTEVAAAGGPSDSYMTSLRKAAQGDLLLPEPRGNTQKAIESAARWAPGSTLKVWQGEEPTPASTVNLEKATIVGGGSVGKVVSDQELVQRLWNLLDERNVVDMFVLDALQAVEARLNELRMERNRLAHGIGTTRDPRPVNRRVEIGTYTEDDLRDVVTEIVKDMLMNKDLTPDAVRRLQVAAHDDETSIEAEQGHDEHP